MTTKKVAKRKKKDNIKSRKTSIKRNHDLPFPLAPLFIEIPLKLKQNRKTTKDLLFPPKT